MDKKLIYDKVSSFKLIEKSFLSVLSVLAYHPACLLPPPSANKGVIESRRARGLRPGTPPTPPTPPPANPQSQV